MRPCLRPDPRAEQRRGARVSPSRNTRTRWTEQPETNPGESLGLTGLPRGTDPPSTRGSSIPERHPADVLFALADRLRTVRDRRLKLVPEVALAARLAPSSTSGPPSRPALDRVSLFAPATVPGRDGNGHFGPADRVAAWSATRHASLRRQGVVLTRTYDGPNLGPGYVRRWTRSIWVWAQRLSRF